MQLTSLADLLDLQEIDLQIDRLLDERQSLPELARYKETHERVQEGEKRREAAAGELRQLELALDKAERPLETQKFLKANPATTPPWEGIMKRNTPGNAPPGAPVFLAQGTADTIVRPYITKQFGEALCKQGAKVMFVEMPGVTHTFAAKNSVATALKWMDDRFRGVPAPSVCGR